MPEPNDSTDAPNDAGSDAASLPGTGAGRDAEVEAPAGERPHWLSVSPLSVLLVVGVAVLLVQLGVSVVSGESPTFLGVVFGPVLLSVLASLVFAAAQGMRTGQYGLAIGATAVVLLVGGFIASGAVVRSIMFPTAGAQQRLPAAGTEVDFGCVVVEYTSEDGVVLRGLVKRTARQPARATLVYFHGNAECAAWNAEMADTFSRLLNVDVFVAEYRGYGSCAGSPGEAGLLRDGRAALAAVELELGVAPAEVVLVGRSLGTGVASAMAGEGAGKGLILFSPYTCMGDLAARMVSRPIALLAVRDHFDSKTRLAQATQPVLIVHGTRDRVIPHALGAELAASLGERVTFRSVEGYGHNDLFHAGDTIVAEMNALLDRVGPR